MSSVSKDTEAKNLSIVSFLRTITEPLPIKVAVWVSDDGAIQVWMGKISRAFRINTLDDTVKPALRLMLIEMANEYMKLKEGSV